MHPLIQPTLCHTAQLFHHTTTHSQPHPDQCATTSCSFLTVQRVTRTQTLHQTAHKTVHQMRRKISKQYLLMMNIGQQKWYQREHFAYMKMGYQTMYDNTHALMGIIITLSHIWTAWKSATFLTMRIT